MNIKVYSFAYGDRVMKQAAVTNPFKREYCRRHGYAYYYSESDKMPVRHPYWIKIEKAFKLLPLCDILVYMDVDAAPVEFDIDLERFMPDGIDFAVCKDIISWNGEPWYFNAGVFMLRNCEFSFKLLAEWDKEDEESKKHQLHDQTRINGLYKQNWNNMRIHTKVWEKNTLQSTSGTHWKPGCLIKHCAGCRIGNGFDKEFWKNLDVGKLEKFGVKR